MLSRDLMFSSRVKAAAEQAGFVFQVGRELPPEQGDSIAYVILDLATAGERLGEILDQCRQGCPQARLIAYGPHVQAEKLESARAAGITTVMTNGQFSSQLPGLFAS
jgi:hypothetical protein